MDKVFDKIRNQTEVFKSLIDESAETIKKEKDELEKQKKLFKEMSEKIEKVHFPNVVTLNIGNTL
jgi:hypothetical protein